MKLAYLIPRLALGGAERQLWYLVRDVSKRHEVLVITFYEGGSLWEEFASLPRVRLVSLDRKSRWDFHVIRRMADLLRREQVDVLHTYLNATPTLGLLAARRAEISIKIVSIRYSEFKNPGWALRVYLATDRWLSNFAADCVIANSEAGRRVQIRAGYNSGKFLVIPNGIDTARFASPVHREAVRAGLGIPPESPVIGMVARLDPLKDHATFLKAAAIVLRSFPRAVFLVVGGGDPADRRRLETMGTALGIRDHVIFTGPRADIPDLLHIMDVAVLCSFAEGFANSVGEAMAAGRPVIVSDVGDMSAVVGNDESGFVVPPADPEAVAQRIELLLSQPARAAAMGRRGAQRIADRYSVQKMVEFTERVYDTLAKQKTGVAGRETGTPPV